MICKVDLDHITRDLAALVDSCFLGRRGLDYVQSTGMQSILRWRSNSWFWVRHSIKYRFHPRYPLLRWHCWGGLAYGLPLEFPKRGGLIPRALHYLPLYLKSNLEK